MSICTKKHYVKQGNKETKVPCYYIAGICVVDPIHQGTMELFLRSTYPYFHATTYEQSKQMNETLVPNNILFANANL